MSLDLLHRWNQVVEPSSVCCKPLKFGGDNAFHQELHRRVDAEFKRMGCSQRDSARMYLKAAIILCVFVLAYVSLAFFATSGWQALPLSILLGITIAGIGFNIMHDGDHQAWSERRWINRFFATTVDMVGGSSYTWQWKHGRFHHTWVNVAGHDSDIDVGYAGAARLRRCSCRTTRSCAQGIHHCTRLPTYPKSAICCMAGETEVFGDAGYTCAEPFSPAVCVRAARPLRRIRIPAGSGSWCRACPP